MKKMYNGTTIEGLVYQHDLELKVSGPNSANPGTEFISGNIEIATDNAMVNIVPQYNASFLLPSHEFPIVHGCKDVHS